MSAAGGDFRVLGTLEVAGADGGALSLGGPKPRALLAALLIGANERVPVDRLVEALWGPKPPATARHSIEVYVSALRKALGAESIVRERSGYRLCIELDQLDAHRFESLMHRGEEQLVQGRAERAAEILREALALWRGAALADVAYHDFARIEAERLEELRLTAIETRLDAELVLGRQDGTVAELQALVAEYPLRERFRAQLMLALYRRGRQADALDVYRETWSTFVEELGLEPGEELRELERRVLAQDPSLFPTVPARAGFLPAQVDTFVGRHAEVAEVTELLEESHTRLVTLTGPGGIGKTRLAVAAAAGLETVYPDGVWFVDLAPLRDASLVGAAIAQRLEAEHIGERHVLLVLDNFEQLLAAAREVSSLLVHCPNLNVLVTSRERLRLRGEHVYEVPPLGEAASLALFADRARSHVRAFELSNVTTRICRRLEGLPLAIELAAARASEFEQEELSSRLERTMAVARGPIDAPPRQTSMHSAVEWSYELLDDVEQRLFARLGVFSGGWTVDAAESITGATRAEIDVLVDKSLVRRDAGRLTMLETIREFAVEELAAFGETEDFKRRHAEWCLALAERAGEEMDGPGQQVWWERLDAELGNLRAAMGRLLERGDTECAARIAVGMMRFWSGRGHHVEGIRWFGQILEREEHLSPQTRARAQQIAGVLDFLHAPGGPVSLGLTQMAYETFVEIGDRRGAARCLDHLGCGHVQAGQLEQALQVFQQAYDELEAIGDEWGMANCLGHLGVAQLVDRRFEQAFDTFDRCLEIDEGVGDLEIREYALLGSGTALLELGMTEESNRRVLEALHIGRDLGDKAGVVGALEALAAIAAEQGDAPSTARFLAVAASVREEMGLPIHPVDHAMLQPHLDNVGIQLGEVEPVLPGIVSVADAVDLALSSPQPVD
jgi:predicted ATPase/DNA-binding SARP family transcriptional activator